MFVADISLQFLIMQKTRRKKEKEKKQKRETTENKKPAATFVKAAAWAKSSSSSATEVCHSGEHRGIIPKVASLDFAKCRCEFGVRLWELRRGRRVNWVLCQSYKDSTEVWCALGTLTCSPLTQITTTTGPKRIWVGFCIEKFSCMLKLMLNFTYKLQQMEGFGVPCWRMAPSDHVHVPYDVSAVSLGSESFLGKVRWSRWTSIPTCPCMKPKLWGTNRSMFDGSCLWTLCLCTTLPICQEHQCRGILQWQSGMALSIL